MHFSKEYVGYLAREISKKLVKGEIIKTENLPALTERVHSALLEELMLEDRINDEVRVILETYSEDMRRTGPLRVRSPGRDRPKRASGIVPSAAGQTRKP